MILGDYLPPHDMEPVDIACKVMGNLERARPEGRGYDSVTTRLTEPMDLLMKVKFPVCYGIISKGTLIITKHQHLAAISHSSCQLPFSCTPPLQ